MAHSTVSSGSGKRVFVIGDIHGCIAEPEILLRHLEEREGLAAEDLVVFLGDYIDRGKESKQVIDLLLQFKFNFPKTRFLKGNHEDMLMDFLGFGGRLGSAFLYNGGLETIQSYGISVFSPPSDMVNSMPKEHFKFFCDLETVLTVDDFILVHAGLNPFRDVLLQNDGDVMWIRDEFLNHTHPFKKSVIFGHTPHQEIFVHLPYKVGIDTGLVFGNKLTCLELRSGKLLEISRGDTVVKDKSLDITKAYAKAK